MKHFFSYLIISLLLVSGVSTNVLSSDTPTDHHKKPEANLSVEMFSLFMGIERELPSDKIQEYWHELNKLTALLEKKKARYKNEEAFLKYLFHRVHRQYLKNYKHHTTLSDVFENGKYNCVTGTALYAMLLDAIQINYQIRETPYHVFLMVYSADGADSVLMESTDPHGFVTDSEDIAKAIDFYQQPRHRQEDPATVYDYDFEIDERINLQKLAGLNYFNQAVDYYNEQQLQKAMQYLRQAAILYPTKRMDALHSLIFQTVQKAYSSR